MDDKFQSTSRLLNDTVAEAERRQARLKKALAEFKKQGCADDPCAAHVWLKTNASMLEREAPELLSLADNVERLCNDRMMVFESDLRDAFSREGWRHAGQWPKYYLEDFLPVVIDQDKLSVTVGEDKLATLDVKRVAASAKAQLQRLRPDRKAVDNFLKDLFFAYSRLAPAHSHSVSIWDLYKEMVVQRQPAKFWRDASPPNFRPFRELEFRALLTELLKAGTTATASRQLRLLPPTTRDESMFIYQPVENRFCHVGRVEFMTQSEGGDNRD